MSVRIIHGETPTALEDIPDGSIDACVTDPPYGIGFMGKEWDTFKPDGDHKRLVHPRGAGSMRKIVSDNPNVNGRTRSPALSPSQIAYDESLTGHRSFQAWTERWALEVFRVLKPGGHLLCCGAPRSYHRMACGIEDAGFEVRDAVLWIFGQGFPKSHNLKGDMDGWGTALKPAWEPIILARKPFRVSVAANVDLHGTGALNIDACRIASGEENPSIARRKGSTAHLANGVAAKESEAAGRMLDRRSPEAYSRDRPADALGRWPANVIHDGSDCVVAEFPDTASGLLGPQHTDRGKGEGVLGAFQGRTIEQNFGGDTGSAARFFYCAKASRADRDDGMEGFALMPGVNYGQAKNNGSGGLKNGTGENSLVRNFHPTVKPTELMAYLCKLVTPPGGTVLDPFMGSGSTGRGAVLGGFSFIGVEREAEYVEIARARIRAIAPLFAEVA